MKSWKDLLAEAGDVGFDPIPTGRYDMKVIESSVRTSSTGKTMYAVTCEVQGGPHARRRVWHNFVVSPESPNALTWFFRNMATLGLKRDFFQHGPSDDDVARALEGRTFTGEVGIRTWNGTDRNEITGFLPAAGRVPAPAPAPVPAAMPPVPVPPAF